MERIEKRAAVLASAAIEVEQNKLGSRQIALTLALAKIINKFMDRRHVEMELAALVLDGLAEELCVAVYDEAVAGKRVKRPLELTVTNRLVQ